VLISPTGAPASGPLSLRTTPLTAAFAGPASSTARRRSPRQVIRFLYLDRSEPTDVNVNQHSFESSGWNLF